MSTYYSAAKINLYLEVRGKADAGYHELISVMQSVSLYDRLDFDFDRRDFFLDTGKKDLGAVEKNTVTRTWKLMKETFDLPQGVGVTLSKNIPMDAGLGGGSGNAAAAFHAINNHFALGLSTEALCELGANIGADVPFCIMGGTALAKGKGEKLTKLKDMPKSNLLLANNGISVSTKGVFDAFDALSSQKAQGVDALLAAIEEGDLAKIGSSLFNDLEAVTVKEHPTIGQQKKVWSDQGLYPLMTGSGPSIFAIALGTDWKEPFVSWQSSLGKLYHVTPVSFGVNWEADNFANN